MDVFELCVMDEFLIKDQLIRMLGEDKGRERKYFVS